VVQWTDRGGLELAQPKSAVAAAAGSRTRHGTAAAARGWGVGLPAKFSVDQKLRIVLAVLEGESTIAQAARDHGVSTNSISAWKRRFLDAGLAGLAGGATRGSPCEAQLLAENATLKAALHEAEVLVRVWRMSAHHHHGRQGDHNC
jgi:transposase